ncbi:MAG: spore coat protein CotJB [Clostridia bacterium]|nr:spore coat protein CotJB [Clostridia bacterium]
MNERMKLMRSLGAQQFAAWELHLYLDTHPCDEDAKRMHDKHMARAAELKAEYESKYGPLTAEGDGCEWLKDPWPWERGV